MTPSSPPPDALDVWIGEEPEPAGQLWFEPDTGEYVFRYHDDESADEAVSLMMPRGEEHRFQILHPIFNQNLPEGALREYIEGVVRKQRVASLYSRYAPDLELLAVTGPNSIGRVRVTPKGTAPQRPFEHSGNVEALLESGDDRELLEECLQRFGIRSGISGIQPKILLDHQDGRRLTLPVDRYIVKFAQQGFPSLAFNEYLCLQAGRHAGLETAEARLSDDGRRLVVTRFDQCRDGSGELHPLGFEEACTLALRPAHGKYDGDYLDMARLMMRLVQGPGRQAARKDLFTSIALSMTLRNGDAHLKNFGLLYENSHSPARLAPVYDVVTTTLYLPKDKPALAVEGRKEWPDGGGLARLGRRMGLSWAEVSESLGRVRAGIQKAREEAPALVEAHPRHAEAAQRMEKIWSEGLESMLHGLPAKLSRSLESSTEEAMEAAYQADSSDPALPCDPELAI